ncbi:MAG: hypothetical protein QOE45_1208 [Frankiaceae bacterium]|nr:hypothetical protein [Frankiaceae bacterium]
MTALAWRGVAAVAAVAAAGFAYRTAFPDRPDYPGHLLAGAGATLLLLALVLAIAGPDPWRVVAVVAVAVLLGVGTEATIFRYAEFDPVDFANQSVGAALACAGFLDARRAADPVLAAVAGVVFLLAGFHYAFA